jgi:predicted nucleic-acid-binding protein
MRAVDTNVLVRLIARDDPAQTDAAEAFVAGGAWVSVIVLTEAIWVLDSVYGLGRASQAMAVELLLRHKSLSIHDREMVGAALTLFRENRRLGFSDCLILESARKAGHLPLGTFDAKLGRIRGAQRI